MSDYGRQYEERPPDPPIAPWAVALGFAAALLIGWIITNCR